MKKLITGLMLALFALGAQAQFIPGQVLTAAQLNAQFALYMPIAGGTLTGPLTVPTLITANAQISGGSISGISPPIPIASGGTSANTALGVTAAIQYQGSGSGAATRSVASKLSDVVSVLDYQGVSCNGSNDDTTGIQNAITQNPGKFIRFPYTGNTCIINSTLSQATPPVSFMVDSGVTFGGSVAALPAAYTNSQQVNVGSYFVQTPGYANTNGASPLQVESLPSSSFTGNAVALYAATRAPLGNPAFTGLLWAGNFLTTLSASTGTYNGQVLELDLNNHYKNSAGYGILITGLGEFNSTAAINIDRSNNTSDWQTGVWIKHFGTYGIHIDGSTSTAPQYGLSIGGMDSGHIRLTPLDSLNPTATMFAIQNSTGTTNMLTMAANGNINGAGATFTSGTVNGPLAVTGTVSGSGFSSLLSPYALLSGSSFTGNVAVGTSSAHINVNDTSGSGSAYVAYQNNGTINWRVLSASSSDVFTIDRFTSGSFTDSPISIAGATGLVSFSDGISPSQTAGIVGTTTNNNANAGSVGEYQSTTGASTGMTSASYVDLATISLTAGDWDTECTVSFVPAASTTVSALVVGIGTTANSNPNSTVGVGQTFVTTFTTGAQQILNTPVVRESLSATTTIRCGGQANFGTSTLNATGFIRARRVR